MEALAISSGASLDAGIRPGKAVLKGIGEREAIPVLRVRAKLAQVTPVPNFETIHPYKRALVIYAYEDIEVLEGSCDEERILVKRWGLMDKVLVPGMPAKVGEVHELLLEPEAAHPELSGELTKDEVRSFEAIYYHVGVQSEE